jgi:hypothetical protein
MTRMIIFMCTRARGATNDAGSHNYEQEELPVLCEEVFLKCRTSITVGVSEGSSLWKDQRDQWDSQQCYQASGSQDSSQVTKRRRIVRQRGRHPLDTPGAHVYCFLYSPVTQIIAQSLEISVRSPGTMLRELES